MLTKVAVANYQSIGTVDLKLGALNVIVGRGDLGKSALLRAISAALFNETGTDFIRHGENGTCVGLAFGDDMLVWTKPRSGSAHYILTKDGQPQTYNKLGSGVPQEVSSFLGIREIEIDKTFSICPQVHGQFDSPMLLAESPGKAARALAKLTKLEIIVQAQMAAARDNRRTKQDVTAREREITDLESRVAEFPDVVRIEKRLAKAKSALAEADTRIAALAQVEEAVDLLDDATARAAGAVPTVREIAGLGARIDSIQNAVLASKVYKQADAGVAITYEAVVTQQGVLISAQQALSSFEGSLNTCPLCGQSWNGDHGH